jgi:succinate dehydrogenase/fumarate reductase flavoprotein subunit
MLDLGELVFTGALGRQETRGLHERTDYPLTNPRLNNKVHVIRKANGAPVTEWRNIQK